MNYRRLVHIANDALRRSQSPYSSMKVGSAILTSDGEIFTGCNIETSSLGLTICAERTAIFKAISEGKNKFRAIAVVSEQSCLPPCGACRQVLHDLAGDIDIVQVDRNNRIRVSKLSTLFPFPFDDRSFKPHKKRV